MARSRELARWLRIVAPGNVELVRRKVAELVVAAISIVAMVLLGSCRRTAEEAPPAACTKVGQTCKLAPGLLGVCTEAAPGTCAREPCLVCMGQH